MCGASCTKLTAVKFSTFDKVEVRVTAVKSLNSIDAVVSQISTIKSSVKIIID